MLPSSLLLLKLINRTSIIFFCERQIEMRLDPVSDVDLLELQRLSREMLVVMRRAHLHDAILADLLDELQQQATTLYRERAGKRPITT